MICIPILVAAVAAVGIGLFDNIEDAAEKLVTTKNEYLPSGADYTEAYNRFCSYDAKLN